ncbi:hypothetical protein [Wenxinia marina]|uniref:Uncharacterized protein n=1 Tax=Wenxinia marina DSM 24838 TaxID=1123501 RepID=A0A0D0NSK5_9RHOB|nr:hypothetical protein [Wenxinia marina]KIQ71180.1 hypothetical protein Wenmar_00559 [Wenxinia marina DSM 24838]GGL81839.1 hypothetical protein GCM10011392_40570 [Wenxinia marina]
MNHLTTAFAATLMALPTFAPAPAAAQDWTQPDWGDQQTEQAERNRRTGQIIAGAAVLGILGLALRNQRDDEDDEDRARHDDRWDDAWDDRGRRDDFGRWDGHDPRWNDWAEPRGRGQFLPTSCLRRFETRRGDLPLFDSDCLNREVRHARDLPLDCAVTVRSEGRFVSGFDPNCLTDRGYRIANRD